MPSYRIYTLKEAQRKQFRAAPHVSGESAVKRKDYEEAGTVETSSEYAAWALLRETGRPLDVGDLLETDTGGLRICKYVGFEAAHWLLPESAHAPAEAVPSVEPPAAE
jgi:hypothetical protein